MSSGSLISPPRELMHSDMANATAIMPQDSGNTSTALHTIPGQQEPTPNRVPSQIPEPAISSPNMQLRHRFPGVPPGPPPSVPQLRRFPGNPPGFPPGMRIETGPFFGQSLPSRSPHLKAKPPMKLIGVPISTSTTTLCL